MSDRRFTRELTDQEIDQTTREVKYYGYAVLPKLMTTEAVEFFKSKVTDLHQTSQSLSLKNVSANQALDKYVYNLQYKHSAFVQLLTDGNLKQILMRFLNDPYYQQIPSDKPNNNLSYYNARSSIAFLPLHLDSGIPGLGPWTWSMQVAYLLEDQDESNGCTRVVPGSHLVGEFADRSFERDIPVIASAGDAIIWDSRLWHGAGENKSLRSRWSMIATFRRWFLKNSMDIPRGMPEEIYSQLTDEEKALMGFCSIPPKDENEFISTKRGYSDLKPRVQDYY
jgi:hypothetical protein